MALPLPRSLHPFLRVESPATSELLFVEPWDKFVDEVLELRVRLEDEMASLCSNRSLHRVQGILWALWTQAVAVSVLVLLNVAEDAGATEAVGAVSDGGGIDEVALADGTGEKTLQMAQAEFGVFQLRRRGGGGCGGGGGGSRS